MVNANSLLQVAEEETEDEDDYWTVDQNTETFVELQGGNGELITVSAWDSNDLEQWNLTYRTDEDEEPVISDEIPIDTEDVEDELRTLLNEN